MWTDADTDGNGCGIAKRYAYRDGNSNRYRNSNRDGNSNRNRDSDSHSNANNDVYTEGYADAATCADAKDATNAAAETIAKRVDSTESAVIIWSRGRYPQAP